MGRTCHSFVPPILLKARPQCGRSFGTLLTLDELEKAAYDFLVLPDATSPAREFTDVSEALQRLKQAPDADGVVSVSQPAFNPIWHSSFSETGGWSTFSMREVDIPVG